VCRLPCGITSVDNAPARPRDVGPVGARLRVIRQRIDLGGTGWCAAVESQSMRPTPDTISWMIH
jgi:hypothetical protein